VAPAFHIENFGCRAARADGEAVGDRLRAGGLCESHPSLADVVIVNTCSVTAEADRAARAFIRRAHRLNPEARILVTGCYAQRAPAELAGLDGVTTVVGNSHKALVPAIAIDLLRDAHPISAIDSTAELVSIRSLLSAGPQGSVPIWADDRFAHSFLEEAQLVPGEQTRPNLKIQEGCGNRCTFCVIPQTRGSSRSLPADAVLRQVEGFVVSGGNELVLSGINLGRWGRDLARERNDPSPSLAALVRRIFAETALPRLRLSSVEPMDWDPDMIGLMRDFGASQPEPPRTGLRPGGGRLARHAHLPLQSGSDAVLRRMHRRYRPWHYAEKVAALLAAAGPALTLGADVMVGFPGESNREFDETCAFIRSLPFGYLHLFPFSPRPGTRGWALHAESPVPARVVEDRMATLRILAAEKSESHRRRFVGRDVEAITLHSPPGLQRQGRTAALTENFLPAEIDAPLPANQLVRLRVTGLDAELALQMTVAGEGSVQ
jgi:threonylcarbamoyladenosine tRNA methylthiotransferase MtaB